MFPTFALGLDYGTNSVRAVVVACADGRSVGTGVFDYPSGDRGVLVDPRDPHLARQNPADYLAGLEEATKRALAAAEADPTFRRDRVIGIGVDTTGSTPIPVDAGNVPLAVDPRWSGNLAAHAWLWKDHTGAREAADITAMAREHAPGFLSPIGGTYSSEWFWSKIWRCLKVAPDVFEAAESWVELADWVPSVLAGVTRPSDVVRSVCAAGHKGLYVPACGGLPPEDFLARLDPRLAALRSRLYDEAFAADRPAGHLDGAWAERLGLPAGIPIAMGGFDAHYGAVGAGIRPGTLVKIIGTSTCDIAIAPAGESLDEVPGICGIVDGSVMPGYHGLEAGQSAVGDLLHWWVSAVCEGDDTLHATLSDQASELRPGASGLVALDCAGVVVGRELDRAVDLVGVEALRRLVVYHRPVGEDEVDLAGEVGFQALAGRRVDERDAELLLDGDRAPVGRDRGEVRLDGAAGPVLEAVERFVVLQPEPLGFAGVEILVCGLAGRLDGERGLLEGGAEGELDRAVDRAAEGER